MLGRRELVGSRLGLKELGGSWLQNMMQSHSHVFTEHLGLHHIMEYYVVLVPTYYGAASEHCSDAAP